MHDALAATPSTPAIVLDHTAREHSTVGLDALSGDLQAEAIQAAERGQIRRGEGSVRHVEVFPMGSVRTPIM
jgi:hypothetical protein